jgi:amino-acid N-acetyltransferase
MIINHVPLDDEAEELLASSGLTISDLHAGNSLIFFGIRDDSGLAGIVGVENYGLHGLLRSLAVRENARNCGYGRMLVVHAEACAGRQGIRELYLLTTTAAGYFALLGYREVQRDEAPETIRKSAQFSSLCPSSSSFMKKIITGPSKKP